MLTISESIYLVLRVMFILSIPSILITRIIVRKTKVKSTEYLCDTISWMIVLLDYIILLIFGFPVKSSDDDFLFMILLLLILVLLFLYMTYSSYKKYKLAKKSELLEKEYNLNFDKD